MSRTFIDAVGDEWSLFIDAPTIRRVRQETCDVDGCKHHPLLNKNSCTALDLANFDGTTFKVLEYDVVLLVDVLWLLCEDQAKARTLANASKRKDLLDDLSRDRVQATAAGTIAQRELEFEERRQEILRKYPDIDGEEFARRLGGDVIAHAEKALQEAYLDNLPPVKRQFLEKITARQANLRELALTTALEKIEDPELQRKAVEALEEALGEIVADSLTRLKLPTGSRASAASAPTG